MKNESSLARVQIPLVHVHDRALDDFLAEHLTEARAVLRAAQGVAGIASRVASRLLMPLADRSSREWLARTHTPYMGEIHECAKMVGLPGVYALNAAYEWACTTGAFATGSDVTLLRVLDWGFPELGKRVMVLRQPGQAGDFYNITWPGFSGSVNGLAPGRFAAAINIAPMRKHGLTLIGDWIKNQLTAQPIGMPPAHLLRIALSQCDSYTNAKELLSEFPVCAPVIYTLTGVTAGEGCIIERTENAARVRELGDNARVTTANHFLTELEGLRYRYRPRGVDSHGRHTQSCGIAPENVARATDFEWLSPPIVNWETRLALIANAATGRLLVQGFEGDERVTEVFDLHSTKTA